MAVSETVTLPAQPTAGGFAIFSPMGGNGQQAPLGCYFVKAEILGDASGGLASVVVNLDSRYTNLVAYVNAVVEDDAAAGDFVITLGATGSGDSNRATVVGTIPEADVAVEDHSAFLWFPPPLYFGGSTGAGSVGMHMTNVGALETYKFFLQVYCFDVNVQRLTPLPFLQMNVPGVSAPASV